MSDRILGLAVLALAVWFGLEAQSLETGLSDPLGAAAFPTILVIAMGGFSLYLLLRPDPNPRWTRGRPLLLQLLTVGSLVAYAYLLEPLGFLLATALETAILAALLASGPWRGVLTGMGTSVVLYVIFNNLLGLPLPGGPF